ncbi:MAG: L,D-transpeptidase family protein [Rhodospirillaceae bacterium]
MVTVIKVTDAGLGLLAWPGGQVRCAIGRSGISVAKREGDGATPAGEFPLRHLLYRPDRLVIPLTGLAVAELRPDDCWCDDPDHPDYNQPVSLPFAASHERMWRDDGLYDVVVVLGHNDRPPVPGLGSAIFLHVVRPGYEPTEGCVALALPDLLRLVECCDENTILVIAAA